MAKSLLLLLSFTVLLVCIFAAVWKVQQEPERPSTFSENYVGEKFWLEPDNLNVYHVNQVTKYSGEIMNIKSIFLNNGQVDYWQITYSYKDPNGVILYNTQDFPNSASSKDIIYDQQIPGDYSLKAITFNELIDLYKKNKLEFTIEVEKDVNRADDTGYISSFNLKNAQN